MIRVGFVLEDNGWMGGVNYYRNLFSALQLLPEKKLHPIVFVASKAAESFVSNFSQAEIVRTTSLDAWSVPGLARRVIGRALPHYDFLLSALLRRHDIDVLSHRGPLWLGGRIKTMGWITDFQHVHLPEFFSKKEIRQRDVIFNSIVCKCDRVLLSSETAQHDLESFSPGGATHSRVLRFVPDMNLAGGVIALEELERKYAFKAPYFYLPNQFWVHKNHKLVIAALDLLRRQGVTPLILATGRCEDYRHPQHFTDLMGQVKALGLGESFKPLGVVPYRDLLALMWHSIGVINPSLFEGWSTTVEEAKALGKIVLLSDIAIHREQNPRKALFFNPRDEQALAQSMLQVINRSTPWPNIAGDGACDEKYQLDRMNFARTYQDIVVELSGVRQSA